jgi:hypothetical protein
MNIVLDVINPFNVDNDIENTFNEAIRLVNNSKYKEAYEKIEYMYKNENHKGHPRALNFVGVMYENGEHPFEQNIEKAIEFYEKSAILDSPQGKQNLGRVCFERAMQCIYNSDSECDKKGLELIKKATEFKHEDSKKFMTAYYEAKKLYETITPLENNKSRKEVVFALHKSIQDRIKILDEERQRSVLEFITYGEKEYQDLTIKQLSKYLLLLAHIIYLHDEAPSEEQNIFMITELLDAGITDYETEKSDIDRLYDMTREKKGNDYLAIKIYDMYHALTGSNSYTSSFASQIAENCRELFHEISSFENVFSNTSSCDDVEILADILFYSFVADGIEDLDNWEKENNKYLIAFRNELVNFYNKLDEKISNVAYEQLLNSVLEPFSKSALEGYIKFYREFR